MYESYYGLDSKPFQLTPDPAFFFASKWHKRAMSYLQYGLSQAEGFIVITGDIGTGKTTIANSLLAEIEDDIIAAQIVTPKLSPDELVKMVAAKFDLEVAGLSKADILDVLEHFLYDLSKQGKRALLLVDEAQNLPLETIEELRMLSNFQQFGKPLLQSFLLGQEELQPILRAPNMEQFRQRIVASCHLAPMTEDETQHYIEFRMQHAGWQGKRLLSDKAYAHIYQFTRGVPRKINTLMDRILLYGFLEELEVLTEEAVNAVIEEVKDEMFLPQSPKFEEAEEEEDASSDGNTSDGSFKPTQKVLTPNGNEIKEVEYYKGMLSELVDALDDAISHKIKLTQYIDKLLKKKYRTYVRLKGDEE
ncbi:XrtA/PEP-CTERM system-associated ATPase [Alteromonas ponticola]|uniref:AAA family ATPase n=1 Tax=Alteromonas ponticola TaxID=2720613 RepID=A0ABX1R1X7_9ALTE|nr:XrtA/PEP-CTERM system-associated ATPase [Alteromonas ponticola]NMH59077.1 AAA family ATPase [Alteromonas ponticola]